MSSARVLPLSSNLAFEIDEAEYARLLGYPRRKIPAGSVAERATRSRDWFARNARPWAYARTLSIDAIGETKVELADGTSLTSETLAARLREAGATAIEIAAVSAGAEVDERSEALWQAKRPDEAYLLDRFAAAVAEHLAAWTGQHLRENEVAEGLAALPGYSPGYEGWDLEEQVLVAACLTDTLSDEPLGPFEVLDSGMIRPKNSLLAVFGLSPDRNATASAWRTSRCGWCSLPRCDFRRKNPKRLQ
jgi:hypothetical protein